MQFHVLSFEGPDPYSRAGDLASRVEGLTEALAELGFETHLCSSVIRTSRPRRRGRLTPSMGSVGEPHHPGASTTGRAASSPTRTVPPFLLGR